MNSLAKPELFFLDDREQSVVLATLRLVGSELPEQGKLLSESLARLGQLATLIHESPPIADSWHASPRSSHSNTEPLIALLCRVPDYDLDLNIPTKAVIGQAYLVAKINFFKALGYAVESSTAPVAGELRDRLQFELGQSIYSKLAEELFLSIVTDPTGADRVRESAGAYLFRIWEERLLTEIDDFAPVLESIWRARNKVRPVLGTMLGTQELFDLVNKAQDPRFVDYFSCEGVPQEQLQAFEEFLFGLSYEEIGKLRSYLREQHTAVVSSEEACEVLGRRHQSWSTVNDGPQALYTSYKKRRVKASYRGLTGIRGPKKTAEEYVMTAFIEDGVSP